MPLKAIDVRRTSVEKIENLLRGERETLLRGLEKLYAEELEDGEELPDLGLFLDLQVRVLRRHLQRIVEADEEVDHALDEECRWRAELRTMQREVRAELKRVRKAMRGWFVKKVSEELLGLVGLTPRDPINLVHAAGILVRAFDKGLPPMLPGVEFNESFIEPLRTKSKALAEADEEFPLAIRGTEGARAERARRLAAFNPVFNDVAGLFAILVRLAGRPHLARRLRPSGQEKGLTLKEVKHRRAYRPQRRRKTLPPNDSQDTG